MPTEETQEVFDLLKKYIPEIDKIKEDGVGGIVFKYNKNTYVIKYEPPKGVAVTLDVPPNALSVVFTKKSPTDEDWNFNLVDVDKENYKGTVQCSFPLKPENAEKLREFLDKLAENNKPENTMQRCKKS